MFPTHFITRSRRLAPVSLRLVSPLLIVFALACGGGGGGPTTPPGGTPGNPGTPGTPNPTTTTSVNLQNNAFSPADIQVSPGATVTFTNLDGIDHTVTFDNTSITSVGAYTSGSKTVTMPGATGTYAYHCTIHAGMKGTVAVK